MNNYVRENNVGGIKVREKLSPAIFPMYNLEF